ncbi:MAG: hypothetical protein C4326_06255 [Ignavibacteria bacterium]
MCYRQQGGRSTAHAVIQPTTLASKISEIEIQLAACNILTHLDFALMDTSRFSEKYFNVSVGIIVD